MPVSREIALQRLREKETRLLAEIQSYSRRFRTGIKSSADTSAKHSTDSADMACSANARLSCVHTQLGQLHRALDKVRRVMDGLETGSFTEYGFCEKCGEEIPPARMEIHPEATMCVSCKSKEEQAKKTFRSFKIGRPAAANF